MSQKANDSGDTLDEVALRTISIYQSQGHLIDRLWAYLNHYCLLILILGLVAVPFKSDLVGTPYLVVAIPAIAFLIFSVANWISLEHSLHELFLLRSVAVSYSGITLRGSNKGSILRWHIIAVFLSLLTYIACWAYIKGLWQPW